MTHTATDMGQRRTGERRRKVHREDIDSLAARLIAETWLRNQ